MNKIAPQELAHKPSGAQLKKHLGTRLVTRCLACGKLAGMKGVTIVKDSEGNMKHIDCPGKQGDVK